MKKKICIPRKKIAEFSRRWKVTEFSLFGSVLHDDFRPDSDADVIEKDALENPFRKEEILRMAQVVYAG